MSNLFERASNKLSFSKKGEEKPISNNYNNNAAESLDILSVSGNSTSSSSPAEKRNSPHLMQRKLESRHVQLIAIGGSIGTGLFVTIGSSLIKGGPLGLLLAYTFWTSIILLLTTAVGEMVSFLPVASPFVTMAGRVVDEAFECCAGYNFFIMEALYIPFEITAVNGMIHFWRDDYSPAITLCIQIAIYALINLFAVRLYGESEFWLSIGKLILCIGLLFFTLVTMCGGNPQHDAFGFRNWHVAGGPMGEYITTGSLGKFQGFLGALLSSAFTIVGPEYMSMVSAEAKNPRKTMPTAFKTVLYRLSLFYIGGALSVSILIAYNDPKFIALSADSSNAASSPYVVAMENLGIKALPDIVNALVLTSAFSAGNSYTYCSSRALYGLAERGFAPPFFKYLTKNGVPLYCVGVSIAFSMLSLMQLGSSGATVLNYMVSLCTGSQLLNYGFMCITYIRFYQACNAQGLDRTTFPYTSYFQPYSIYIATFFIWIMIGILGYTVFMPGNWAVDTFLFNYVMIFVCIAIFIFWKLFRKTKFVSSKDADLFTGIEEIEEHEYEYYAQLESEHKSEKGWFKTALHWLF
ncbi:general amino acid permease Agp2p [[Candida] railenensis]|uniref:General amino acid permease Agp2p n=1 Tax=[Candida] railenensis TaxID=45579 RepID=A0A9P0QTG9_9ASCO|nr:general amino acid permease Agp2p [[Candida] railenensis]